MRPTAMAVFFAIVAGSQVWASRVDVPEQGLSVWVPQGWVLETPEPGVRILRDTVWVNRGMRHAGEIRLEVMGRSPEVTNRTWTLQNAMAWRLFLAEQPCYGRVSRHDSVRIDGRFGMFVQGDWAPCRDTAAIRLDIQSLLVRTTSQGDVGWEFSVQSDTADFRAGFFTYRALLDSLRIAQDFLALGVGSRSVRVINLRPVWRGTSWWIERPPGRHGSPLVVDARGRSVGLLDVHADGWSWTPGPSMSAAWFKLPGAIPARAFLPPRLD